MKINEMEKLSGISKKNIRFYEEQGLLSPQRNRENGYREYSMEDLEQIKKIKLLRKLCIPIEEIRNMQNATFTLSECMERHLIYLQREEKNILCTREMCKKIIESENMLESLDADFYLEVMNTMEKEGVQFKNVSKIDQEKKTGSIVTTTIIMIVATVFLIVCVAAIIKEPDSTPIMVIFILSTIFLMVGVLVALKQRMKEIKGGEENEASKY